TSSDDFPSKPPEEQKFLQDVVSYATLLWYHDAQKMAAAGQRLPWYDEHSASETRFRNTLCIIYGSDPARYKPLADRVGLPERERARCEIDYTKRYAAWDTIIAPYTSEQRPADAPGAKVSVVYEPSNSST